MLRVEGGRGSVEEGLMYLMSNSRIAGQIEGRCKSFRGLSVVHWSVWGDVAA